VPPWLGCYTGRLDRRAQRPEPTPHTAGVGPSAALGQVAGRAGLATRGVRRGPVVDGRWAAGQPRPAADRLEEPLVAPAPAPKRRALGAPLGAHARPIAASRRAPAAAAAAVVALAAGALPLTVRVAPVLVDGRRASPSFSAISSLRKPRAASSSVSSARSRRPGRSRTSAATRSPRGRRDPDPDRRFTIAVDHRTPGGGDHRAVARATGLAALRAPR
jgi:hypothetical protein